MADLVKITDWSKYQGRVGRERIQRMKDDGVRGVVVGSWHGLDANPHAAGDLADARALGLKTGTYIVVNNRPGTWTVQQGKAACGAEWEHLSSVWIDVEVAGVTEAILQDAFDEAARLRPDLAASGHIGIYTGRWFWNWWALALGHLPGLTAPGSVPSFSRYPLWTALYNGRFDLVFTPYGGWITCVGHQFAGSTAAYGTTVDFSAFDETWFCGPELVPGVSYAVPERKIEMSSQEYNELKQWVQVSVHDAIESRLAALEQLVYRQLAVPGPLKTPAAPTQRTYTVQSGDILSGIAVKFGVAANRWPEIPNIPPEVRADPRKLQIGTVLIIPW